MAKSASSSADQRAGDRRRDQPDVRRAGDGGDHRARGTRRASSWPSIAMLMTPTRSQTRPDSAPKTSGTAQEQRALQQPGERQRRPCRRRPRPGTANTRATAKVATSHTGRPCAGCATAQEARSRRAPARRAPAAIAVSLRRAPRRRDLDEVLSVESRTWSSPPGGARPNARTRAADDAEQRSARSCRARRAAGHGRRGRASGGRRSAVMRHLLTGSRPRRLLRPTAGRLAAGGRSPAPAAGRR